MKRFLALPIHPGWTDVDVNYRGESSYFIRFWVKLHDDDQLIRWGGAFSITGTRLNCVLTKRASVQSVELVVEYSRATKQTLL